LRRAARVFAGLERRPPIFPAQATQI